MERFRETIEITNDKLLRRVEQRLEHPYPKGIPEYLAGNKIPEDPAKNIENQIFHMRRGAIPPPQKKEMEAAQRKNNRNEKLFATWQPRHY